MVGSLITIVVGLIIVATVSWPLAVVDVLILTVYGRGLWMAFRAHRGRFREQKAITADVTGRFAESVNGIRAVKAYAAEGHESLVYARGIHRWLRSVGQSLRIVAWNDATVSASADGIYLVTIGGGAWLVTAGIMTLGELVMCIFFIKLLEDGMYSLAKHASQVADAFAGLDRMHELKQLTREDADETRRAEVKTLRGDVTFEDVSFAYRPNIPVLQRISFHAPSGTTTALVGSSGSGKSTLISLLLAFNRPQSGRVLVDGRDLSGLRLRDYRAHLGVVLQDNFVFDATILDNIRIARPSAAAQEVLAAGRIAHCEEFVERLPNGYDTNVGPRGVRLSGGQRQRVAIARAILADPPLLLLDEATSSLDSEHEALIQDALVRVRRNRTTFVIAHRLSTIRSADQILVIEKGHILERGTHTELLARHGRYRYLHDIQFRHDVHPSHPGGVPQSAIEGVS
jgi:subfamily B ATP-binding cassette protein MsbA